MRTYKDIYKFPLRRDEWGSYIWDADNQMVAMFEISNSALENNIIGILNDEQEPKGPHNFFHKDGVIIENRIHYILIRGWGNLTGTGGHHLPSEEAANIQDTFAEFIVNRLNSFGINYDRPLIKQLLNNNQ